MKKKNIGLYFLKMFFIFLGIFLLQQIGTFILYISFTQFKFGTEVINEAIWAILVLIVVLLYKNSYIFTDKKEKLREGFKLGLPLLIISTIILALNIISLEGNVNIPVILNSAIYCLLIGIVEEFLCRGWLLNEFLERFSENKKQIITSIILSSLVFGFIHIFNVLVGQSLADTLLQILNATLLGVVFAAIYYKTKNIWSVVLIHAFWDFSIFLNETSYLGNCVTGTVTDSVIIANMISSVLIITALAIICYWLFKQIKFTENDNTAKLSKVLYILLPIISVVVYLGSGLIIPEGYDEYHICTTYEKKSLGDEYETYFYSHKEYILSYIEELEIDDSNEIDDDVLNSEDNNVSENVEYNFKLFLNDNYELELLNSKTNQSVILETEVYNYLLIENDDTYSILIETADINNVVKYGQFTKNEISNDLDYLNMIKDNLKSYYTPPVGKIGAIKVDDYLYAQIVTTTYDILYFGKDNVLYLDQ